MQKPAVVISLLLLISLSACVETAAVRDGGLDALRQQAEAFWQARVEGDLIKAYEFESAKVTGKPTLQQYIRKSSLVYRKATVTEVRRQSDSEALVSVELEYQIPTFTNKPLHTVLEDRWVLMEGSWLHGPAQRRR